MKNVRQHSKDSSFGVDDTSVNHGSVAVIAASDIVLSLITLPPGLPPRTFACTVSSELLGFYFLFFPYYFVPGPCANLSWLSRQLLGAR